MRATVTALSNCNGFRYVFYNIGLFDQLISMHDSRVMWFYSVFSVTVIKSHLCVYSCVFNLTSGIRADHTDH